LRWTKHYHRIAKRFAIFPVRSYASSKVKGLQYEYRWLETVYLIQRQDWIFGIFPCWKTDAFATKREYELYRKMLKEETQNDSGSVSERCD
jgi:hypothetical protein